MTGGKLTLAGKLDPQHSPKEVYVRGSTEMVVAMGGVIHEDSKMFINGNYRWEHVVGQAEISELTINGDNAVFRNNRDLTITDLLRWL